MINIVLDIVDPKLNIKRELAKEHDCRIVEIQTADGTILNLHFASLVDAKAFGGLYNIVVGVDNG